MNETKIGYGNVDKERLQEIIATESKKVFNSTFNFLNQHSGLRPSKMHLAIGPAGGGKTTFGLSIIKDFLQTVALHRKILIWLSEENVHTYQFYLFRLGLTKEQRECIIIISELEMSSLDKSDMRFFLESCLDADNFIMLYFDNITTSALYQEKRVHEQADFISWIKGVCAKRKLVSFILAHTSADVSRYANTIINENHIRGAKSAVNYAEFLYIIQQFINNDEIIQTVRIEKHRGFNIKDKFFRLNYDPLSHVYNSDVKLNYDRFKEILDLMHKRNK